MIKLFLFTILSTISLSITSLAQVEKVNVTFSEKPLDEILKEITRKHNLHFSYDQHLPLLKHPITIEAKELPLDEFLKTLFKKAGANYKVIDDHIAITKKSEPLPPQQHNEKRTDPKAVRQKQHEASKVELNEVKVAETEPETSEKENTTDQPANTPVQEEIRISQDPARKVNNAAVPTKQETTSFEAVEGSTDKTPTKGNKKKYISGDKLSIGIVGSLDSYRFSKPTFEGSRSSFSNSINFSAGIATQYDITHNWLIDAQVRIASRNFDMNYNFYTIDPGDPFVLEKTSFQLIYLNIPINANYHFLQKGNFSFYASGGMGIDLLIADKLTTLLKDGNKTTTPANFGKVNQFVFALQGGIEAQYNLNEQWKVNFSPLYRKYLTKFNDGVEGIDVQMISIEMGIVYRL